MYVINKNRKDFLPENCFNSLEEAKQKVEEETINRYLSWCTMVNGIITNTKFNLTISFFWKKTKNGWGYYSVDTYANGKQSNPWWIETIKEYPFLTVNNT